MSSTQKEHDLALMLEIAAEAYKFMFMAKGDVDEANRTMEEDGDMPPGMCPNQMEQAKQLAKEHYDAIIGAWAKKAAKEERAERKAKRNAKQ